MLHNLKTNLSAKKTTKGEHEGHYFTNCVQAFILTENILKKINDSHHFFPTTLNIKIEY